MLLHEFIRKVLEKRLDHVMTYLLSDERFHTVVVKCHNLLFHLLRAELLNLSDNCTSCYLLDEEGCTSCRIVNDERVSATLITERCIRLEAVSL